MKIFIITIFLIFSSKCICQSTDTINIEALKQKQSVCELELVKKDNIINYLHEDKKDIDLKLSETKSKLNKTKVVWIPLSIITGFITGFAIK